MNITASAPTTFAPSATWRHVVRLPAALLLRLIRLYQAFVSPLVPVVTLGQCACRFSPTCSHYAAEAVRTHGALVGSWLALRRLLKCTPLHPGGIDPVPPRPTRRCAAITPARREMNPSAPTSGLPLASSGRP